VHLGNVFFVSVFFCILKADKVWRFNFHASACNILVRERVVCSLNLQTGEREMTVCSLTSRNKRHFRKLSF
jgi:hypothetical protein